MYIKPLFLNDSQKYSFEFYPELEEGIRDYPNICKISSKEFRFNFTGILFLKDLPIIIFPKNFLLSTNSQELINDAELFIRVLIQYCSDPFLESFESQYLLGENKITESIISTSFIIIEDSKKYGLLSRKNKVSTYNRNGHIQWKKTLSSSIPIINHKRILYNNLIIKYEKEDNSNMIYLIHKYVLYQCQKMWGWLSYSNNEQMIEEQKLPISISKAISILKSELQKSFIDHEVNTLKMLLSFLLMQTTSGFYSKLFGTQYFSFVWEAICRYIFNTDDFKIRALLPQPIWKSEKVQAKISQRPDIFTIFQNKIYILDAKYYNYNINLPGWHDVVKQLFYRHTLLLSLNKSISIRSAFLLPSDESCDISYIGKVYVDNVDEIGEILAFAINQRMTFRCYANQDKELIQNTLISKLAKMYYSKS